MSEARDCPMCGEFMHLKRREEITRVPGGSTVRTTWEEWVCPECDYFQERDPDSEGA